MKKVTIVIIVYIPKLRVLITLLTPKILQVPKLQTLIVPLKVPLEPLLKVEFKVAASVLLLFDEMKQRPGSKKSDMPKIRITKVIQ